MSRAHRGSVVPASGLPISIGPDTSELFHFDNSLIGIKGTAPIGTLPDSDYQFQLDSSILAYYNFNSGGSRDLSGNGRNLTISGATYIKATHDAGDYELTFDGVDDYMQLPSIASIRSIDMWVYIDSTQITGRWNYLFDARTGLSSGWFAQQGIGTNWVKMYINGISKTISTSSIPINQWVHLYVESDTTFTDDIVFFTRYTISEWMKGSIAKLTLYNRALTEQEINKLYCFGIAGPTLGTYTNKSSIVASYDFSEEKSFIYDLSGNDNHASLTGLTWTDGIRGRALWFNGASSFRIQNPIPNTNTFAIEFWIKESSPAVWSDILTFDTGVDTTACRIEKTDINNEYHWYASGVFSGSANLFAHDGSQWDHIVLTSDGINAKCYKNGVETYTQAVNANKIPTCATINIGKRIGNTYWTGRIAKLVIYNRGLTPQEIKDRYNQTTATLVGGEYNNSVWIDQGMKNNYIYNPLSNVGGWNSSPTIDPSQTFRGHTVFACTGTASGGGWRHGCTNGTLELAPNEYAVASIWINKGTVNAMPHSYMQGYTYDGTTWTHRDPVEGYLSVTTIFLDSQGNLLGSAPNSGWYKQIVTIKNIHTNSVRLSSNWYFLSSGFTSGTCYHSEPQLEKGDTPHAFMYGCRTLGRLWYPKELINLSNFTISCWFNIPYMHTASSPDTDGITGSWYHPIIELCPTSYQGTSTGLSIAAGPNHPSYLRRLILRYPGNTYGTATPIQDNTWYYLTATYDGTTYKIYCNGDLKISYASAPPTIYPDTVLMVGGGYYGNPNTMIDELRIENRAIDANEAYAWYISGAPFLPRDPIQKA